MIPKHIQVQIQAFKAKQQAQKELEQKQKEQKQESVKIWYEDTTMTPEEEDAVWDDIQTRWEEKEHQYYLKCHEKAYDEWLDQMVKFL